MDANDIVCYKRHCPASVLSFVFDNVLLKALEPPGENQPLVHLENPLWRQSPDHLVLNPRHPLLSVLLLLIEVLRFQLLAPLGLFRSK